MTRRGDRRARAAEVVRAPSARLRRALPGRPVGASSRRACRSCWRRWRRGRTTSGSSLVTGNFEPIARLKLARAGIGALLRGAARAASAPTPRTARELPPIARARAADPPWPRERTVVIGDTPRDIACARADGVRVAAVATGPVRRRGAGGRGRRRRRRPRAAAGPRGLGLAARANGRWAGAGQRTHGGSHRALGRRRARAAARSAGDVT